MLACSWPIPTAGTESQSTFCQSQKRPSTVRKRQAASLRRKSQQTLNFRPVSSAPGGGSRGRIARKRPANERTRPQVAISWGRRRVCLRGRMAGATVNRFPVALSDDHRTRPITDELYHRHLAWVPHSAAWKPVLLLGPADSRDVRATRGNIARSALFAPFAARRNPLKGGPPTWKNGNLLPKK